MPDGATSTDPAVQAQLDRLFAHGPGTDTLGLDRITKLLARLGDPHRHLPPVFHVAGTNGKGSTCAFLRAALEAAGHRVHVYTSPHLVRFNERIRLAGTLIEDAALAALLAEVLDQAEDLHASFFEVTTAAAFLAFARTPADACVVEVGLGGRLDATNVIPAPAVCGIAALGIDHEAFLGNKLKHIAREKAGIAKANRPLVTMAYEKGSMSAVQRVAETVGARLIQYRRDWHYNAHQGYNTVSLMYVDAASRASSAESGTSLIEFPPTTLSGRHQHRNYMLAVAMLRHQQEIAVSLDAMRAAATTARWPARMQRLGSGPLVDRLPPQAEAWLDGCHNEDAAKALAPDIHRIADSRPVHLVMGILANKDAAGVLRHLAPVTASLTAVPVPGHAHHDPIDVARTARDLKMTDATAAPDLTTALARIGSLDGPPSVVLIAGSLYLAGEALRLNDELPD